MSRDHTRDRAGDQLDLGRLHAHVCRIITCLSEPISIESDPPYPTDIMERTEKNRIIGKNDTVIQKDGETDRDGQRMFETKFYVT